MAILPPCNFIVLHYTYFIITPLICSVVFWGASTPSHSVAYVDALFMCVSAITGAGLNSVCLPPPPLPDLVKNYGLRIMTYDVSLIYLR